MYEIVNSQRFNYNHIEDIKYYYFLIRYKINLSD